jgi:hypothetical protein
MQQNTECHFDFVLELACFEKSSADWNSRKVYFSESS